VIPRPGLYTGHIRHRRFTPRTHQFSYSLCMAFLDIDGLRESMAASWLTSYNRWNWMSFDERDHLGDPSQPLRSRVEASAADSGVTLPDGPIFLLTHLRYAGYVFNPISFFYCYDANGALRAVLAEVNNTYGGRQTYWLQAPAADPAAPARTFRATTAKVLYVSPFMTMDMDYEFALAAPAATLVAHMNVTRGSDQVFDATLVLVHQPWSATSIRGALARFPLMTAKVIAAIHWQALRLYLKGVPVIPAEPEALKGLR